jgi:hypothetical protein
MSKHISNDIDPALDFLWKFIPKLGRLAMAFLLDPRMCMGELSLEVGEVKQMGETEELRDGAFKALFKKHTDDVLIPPLAEMKRQVVAKSGGLVGDSAAGSVEETVVAPQKEDRAER